MSEHRTVVRNRYGEGATRAVPLDRLLAEQFTGSVPWRQFRSRKGQPHLSGRYWSSTVGGHVVYESRLELARLLLVDFESAVASIWAQPCRLEAVIGGVARAHVPGFLLVSTSGLVTVVNVKPAERLADARVAEALAWPGRLFADHGWRVEVWSGATRWCWQQAVDEEEFAMAERRLTGVSGLAWYVIRPALLALLWRGRLVTDLSRPLSARSVLRKVGEW